MKHHHHRKKYLHERGMENSCSTLCTVMTSSLMNIILRKSAWYIQVDMLLASLFLLISHQQKLANDKNVPQN